MTEPEGVEEDFFADLYDADEPTQTAAPSAPATVSSTQPLVTTSSVQLETSPVSFQAPSTENYDIISADTTTYEQPSNFGEHNGVSEFGATVQVDSINMTNAQSEPQGTGIKEDG
ncbi:hypothetical protein PRK78_003432 [Emydomyces testavorans]|uniref:Uncharacterized protein n=1 Tax=Emydomyces testavorans TaxID=2070801 RepID=A0AAF0DIQ8_9EURO|nr:hypothetical protein PRK78_003432 [Emydomyces testavorans]